MVQAIPRDDEVNGKLKLALELARLAAWLDDRGREQDSRGVQEALADVVREIKRDEV